jgi:hypothetical protein
MAHSPTRPKTSPQNQCSSLNLEHTAQYVEDIMSPSSSSLFGVFTREFPAFTREFWSFTREFRRFTRELPCFTREFCRSSPIFSK